MELYFGYNQSQLIIHEARGEHEAEFTFRFHDPGLEKQLAEVRNYFYRNDDLTDAYFHKSLDNEMKVAIKLAYYTDFLLQLFKHKIITSLEWR